MLFRFTILMAAIVSLLATNCLPSVAQSTNAQNESIQLPTEPAAWLNSPPIPIEMLKGKAAVFYFFEEG